MTLAGRTGSDGDLVTLARAGAPDALDELARRHRKSAYLFALQLVGNRDDALDVAQEAMLRFLTNLGRFDVSRPIRPWLLKIVHNQARDLWRRQRARPTESLEISLKGEDEELTREVVDPSPDPESDAQRRQLQRRVWKAVCGLKAAKREILVLRDFHDLAYAEIAEVLGIPIGTVMSRLHGARKSLREALQHDEIAPAGLDRGEDHED